MHGADDAVVLDQQRELSAKLHLDPSAGSPSRRFGAGRPLERHDRVRAQRSVPAEAAPLLKAEDGGRGLQVDRPGQAGGRHEAEIDELLLERRGRVGTVCSTSTAAATGRRRSYPGKSPTGTPPSISTFTARTPGMLLVVRTSWPTRARSAAGSRPAAKRAPRSTVTMRRETVTESSGVAPRDRRLDTTRTLGRGRARQQSHVLPPRSSLLAAAPAPVSRRRGTTRWTPAPATPGKRERSHHEGEKCAGISCQLDSSPGRASPTEIGRGPARLKRLRRNADESGGS